MIKAIAEYGERFKQQYAFRISSSKAFGGIAIGFIVCLFLGTCIVDFRWSIFLYIYYRFRAQNEFRRLPEIELKDKQKSRSSAAKSAKSRKSLSRQNSRNNNNNRKKSSKEKSPKNNKRTNLIKKSSAVRPLEEKKNESN